MCTARSVVNRVDIIVQDLASILGPPESISVHTTETIEELIQVKGQMIITDEAYNLLMRAS